MLEEGAFLAGFVYRTSLTPLQIMTQPYTAISCDRNCRTIVAISIACGKNKETQTSHEKSKLARVTGDSNAFSDATLVLSLIVQQTVSYTKIKWFVPKTINTVLQGLSSYMYRRHDIIIMYCTSSSTQVSMRCAPPARREDISSSASPRRLPIDPITVLTAVLSTDWTPLSWLYTCSSHTSTRLQHAHKM